MQHEILDSHVNVWSGNAMENNQTLKALEH